MKQTTGACDNSSLQSDQANQPAPEESQKQKQDFEAQLKEKENKFLYLYAEFENFKKRMLKERSDLLKFGCEQMVRELLQVVDNLERASAHVPQTLEKTLSDGLQMVLGQFRSILEKQGVQPIDTSKKNFDPHLHEAVGQETSEDAPGTIIKEHSRGYTLHGRLLRPARVVVSTGKSQTE